MPKQSSSFMTQDISRTVCIVKIGDCSISSFVAAQNLGIIFDTEMNL